MKQTITELKKEIADRRDRIIDLAHEHFEVNGLRVAINARSGETVSAAVAGTSISAIHRSKGAAIIANLLAHDICRTCDATDPHTLNIVGRRVLDAMGVWD